jgi:hypothetical protein
MVSRYGVDAAFVAQREVDAKIKVGDLHGALEIDQVRRELLDLIIDIEPPAHYWLSIELSVEVFNPSLRCECLSEYLFPSLARAGRISETWQVDYSTVRANSSPIA